MSSESVTLNSVCLLIVDCLHATAPITAEGYPLIRTPNIGQGRFELSDVQRISQETYDVWTQRAIPQNNDLILGREAPAGNVAIIKGDEKLCLGQRTVLIRPDPKKVDADFLCYYLLAPKQQGFLLSNATGVTAPHVNMKDIRRLPLHNLPSIDIQKKLGGTLSAYDDLMENNRRRMALLEESARLLYREWFVRLRFPGHERTRITAGIPCGWRKTPLGNITTKIGSGSTPRGGEAAYKTEGVTLIRSMNVYDDRFDDDGLAFIGEEQAAALDNVAVQPRDILLNITGASVARCCMAPERYLPARVNQHVMIIRPDPAKADPFFVHAAINSDERKRQLLSYAQKGSTREALTKETISAFEITLPPADLMRQFGEIAEPCFRQRETLALQNQKLRTARDHLLPRLMSGELAV